MSQINRNRSGNNRRRHRSKKQVLHPPFGEKSQPQTIQSVGFSTRRRRSNQDSSQRHPQSNSPYNSLKLAPLPSPHHRRSAMVKAEPKNITVSSRRPPRRYPAWLHTLFIYTLRLLIVGVGMGAIVGTILSKFDAAGYSVGETTTEAVEKESPKLAQQAISLSQEMVTLRSQLQTLMAANADLEPGVFIIDLDTGAYLDWEGATTFSAASTIKVPILLAFFEDVDQGKVRLDEMLTMDESVIAGGSGGMQYQTVGGQYTALETATQMIITSDNTATNMIINRLGGAQSLNQRFQEWGLQTTFLRNPLPDIPGTNTTSAKELAMVMAMVSKGDLLSMQSRDRLLGIMERTRNKSLIPQGLDKTAIVANKTGNIGAMLADVGLIDMPSGKRYIATVMVKRPRNAASAKTLIRQISRLAYQHFELMVTAPRSTNGVSVSKDSPTMEQSPIIN